MKHIYKDEELEKKAVRSFFEHTADDGKKYKIQYYKNEQVVAKFAITTRHGTIER